MRSFKKMLAAVSAVTIAFGAMALTAGAVAPNEGGSVDVSDLGTFVEGGYLRVTFTSTDVNATAAQIAIGFNDENKTENKWTTIGGHYGKAADAANTYYTDFTYEEISNYKIESIMPQNWNAWINDAGVEVALTFTDISYIVPSTTKSFSATEVEEMIAPSGEYADGWYARTFTFSNDSDASVTYAINVNGQEVGKTGSIEGSVMYGIIVASQDQAKLAAIDAPVITIE